MRFSFYTFLLTLTLSEIFHLCNKHQLKKHYSFDEPIYCPPQQLSRVEHCSASVYHTTTHLKRIVAFFCFTKETHWTTHFYFFGSKFKETQIVDSSPPSHQICDSWRATKNTRDGPLTTKYKILFQTENKINYEYTWPTSRSGIIRNHYMIKSVIFYDFF